jgi:hypothetical protein
MALLIKFYGSPTITRPKSDHHNHQYQHPTRSRARDMAREAGWRLKTQCISSHRYVITIIFLIPTHFYYLQVSYEPQPPLKNSKMTWKRPKWRCISSFGPRYVFFLLLTLFLVANSAYRLHTTSQHSQWQHQGSRPVRRVSSPCYVLFSSFSSFRQLTFI